MAQPKWVTPAGSLGVIPENIFFQLVLFAYDPDHPVDPDIVFFEVIAGSLPAGVQCTANGSISGIPKAVAAVQGVPVAVSRVLHCFVSRDRILSLACRYELLKCNNKNKLAAAAKTRTNRDYSKNKR